MRAQNMIETLNFSPPYTYYCSRFHPVGPYCRGCSDYSKIVPIPIGELNGD